MKIHQSMWIQWPFFSKKKKKNWTKGHWPLDDLWHQVCWGHMCDSTQGSLCPSLIKVHQSMWIQWPFFQKLEPKVIDPYMTFDPTSVKVTCVTLPKDHCVQVPWEYINVCGYSDQFCKIPHTYTYYVHTYILRTIYIQNEWPHSFFLNTVKARQKVLRINETRFLLCNKVLRISEKKILVT